MNALVMFDRETGTLWSHFLSKAISGPLKGTRLENIPVTLTTWSKWLEEYPNTLALEKGFSGSSDPYTRYYRSSDPGVIGELHEDERLEPKQLVLGVGFGDGPKAYSHKALERQRVVNDVVTGKPALVYFDPQTGTALAFHRVVDGRELSFDLLEDEDGTYVVDDQTGTRWAPYTGQALQGELAGRAMQRVHSVNVFWFAWTDFFPETEIYAAP